MSAACYSFKRTWERSRTIALGGRGDVLLVEIQKDDSVRFLNTHSTRKQWPLRSKTSPVQTELRCKRKYKKMVFWYFNILEYNSVRNLDTFNPPVQIRHHGHPCRDNDRTLFTKHHDYKKTTRESTCRAGKGPQLQWVFENEYDDSTQMHTWQTEKTQCSTLTKSSRHASTQHGPFHVRFNTYYYLNMSWPCHWWTFTKRKNCVPLSTRCWYGTHMVIISVCSMWNSDSINNYSDCHF